MRSGRLGRVMRWGVYAFCLVLWGLLGLSIFVNLNMGTHFVPDDWPQGNITWTNVSFQSGIMVLERNSNVGVHAWDEVNSGREYWFVNQSAFPPPKREWYGLPGIHRLGGSAGVSLRIEVPLIWASFIAQVASIWIWIANRKRRLVGCCTSCGYSLEGLTGTSCPECGRNHA